MSQTASNQWIRITALAVLCQILNTVAEQQCGGESSIYGMMLRRHTFHKMKTNDAFECLQACNTDVRCQSFNYVMSKDECELSNRTKEARPKDFVSNGERYYMKRNTERVPLGSIQELPAQSCLEIKSSEGASVSGKYWLDSIIPGNAVLAHCDMETDDVNECSTSIPVCNANANCSNTVGSFTCTCKDGFSGDGHRCTAITECANYQSLTAADRKSTFTGQSPVLCDSSLGPGWFRFQGDAGTRMPTSCTSYYRCGTHATCWLNGAHPTEAEGNVTRQVCFSWTQGCCEWSININVRNCGAYFVYYLSGTAPPGHCQVRYCSTD